ncbi:MAG TPA: enoyl-CoA hydratase-related protein [Pseudolabrys sp.]
MPDELLIEHVSSSIVVFRLNRPHMHNALDLAVRKQLAEAVTRFAADPAIRCLVVTGSDKAFASGADLSEMAEATPDEVKERNVQQYWRAISDCPKPLIAAVEGYALGGGLELALCADIIVAGDGARLGLPEVRVGILPGGGGTQRLARLVGLKRAMLLLMTGRMFGAAEALAMGVISEMTPSGQALTRALEIAAEIAAMPLIAIAQIKRVVNEGVNQPLDTALLLEQRAYEALYATTDQKEGMRAFLEKRKPKFEGK